MQQQQQKPVNKQVLFPNGLYDILHKAKLIGEGTIMIKGHFTTKKADRMSDDDATWREKTVLDYDSTDYSAVFVPIKDNNGRVVGDWTDGLTIEEVKRVHEEAKVPRYYADHTTEPDTQIIVHHDMVLDLADPIQMSKFHILSRNSLIALSKKDLIDDQDFYFFNPKEELNVKQKQFEVKTKAIALVNDLALEAKKAILQIMSYEYKGVSLAHGANDEDKLVMFQELCFERAADVMKVHEMPNKEKRIMLHTLVAHAVIISPNYDNVGPYYRVSTNSAEYGALIANTIEEAVIALGRNENIDLARAYEEIKNGKRVTVDPIQKILEGSNAEINSLLKQIDNAPAYQLPEKITLAWLKGTQKAGLQAYMTANKIAFGDNETNAALLARASEFFEKNDPETIARVKAEAEAIAKAEADKKAKAEADKLAEEEAKKKAGK